MIKVMIVDDSAVARSVLQETLGSAADIRVIGTAPDPLFALPKMQREWPDVIITDIEMPRMDGLSFVRQIMATRPTSMVVCSSLTGAGSGMAFQALEAGAFSIISKPALDVSNFLRSRSADIINTVRAAALANARHACLQLNLEHTGTDPVAIRMQPLSSPDRNPDHSSERLIAVGISTGGVQALEYVLTRLSARCSGMVVVQHMPPDFTHQFALRLNTLCQLEVLEARDGDRIQPGRVLIAPGGRHLRVKRCGTHYLAEVFDGPPVSRHRPSVDVLFRSVASAAGPNAMGIIMTGMGDDGARGLKDMADAGALTLAQDEASSVVYGMPKEAVRHGGVHQVVSLYDLPAHISRYDG